MLRVLFPLERLDFPPQLSLVSYTVCPIVFCRILLFQRVVADDVTTFFFKIPCQGTCDANMCMVMYTILEVQCTSLFFKRSSVLYPDSLERSLISFGKRRCVVRFLLQMETLVSAAIKPHHQYTCWSFSPCHSVTCFAYKMCKEMV